MNFGHNSHVKRQKALEHQGSGARLLAEIRCMESYIEGTASSDHTPTVTSTPPPMPSRWGCLWNKKLLI